MLSVSSALLIVVLGMPGAQTAASGPSAGSAPRQVAVVLAQPIYESEIEPRPDVVAKRRTGLDAGAFARWLLQARAQQLAGGVQKRLLNAYAKRFRLEPTEAEIQPLLRSIPDNSREREEAMRSTRERRLEEIRAKLKAPDLSAADRERLTADLAKWEQFPTRLDTSAKDREFMSFLVQNWKVQRSFYQRYGGRVLVSSFGTPVAIDALKKFLQEEEKRGSFEIFDPELRAAFWTATADETWADGVTQGRSADEVFASPPWRTKGRRP
jgi:hypothetical protein